MWVVGGGWVHSAKTITAPALRSAQISWSTRQLVLEQSLSITNNEGVSEDDTYVDVSVRIVSCILTPGER